MGRLIWGQFGGTAHQGRDRDALVAGAAPAVEAAMQGYKSWKYQEAERATNLKVYPQGFSLSPTSQRSPQSPRQCHQVGTKYFITSACGDILHFKP